LIEKERLKGLSFFVCMNGRNVYVFVPANFVLGLTLKNCSFCIFLGIRSLKNLLNHSTYLIFVGQFAA
jgi:hypothetical protein